MIALGFQLSFDGGDVDDDDDDDERLTVVELADRSMPSARVTRSVWTIDETFSTPLVLKQQRLSSAALMGYARLEFRTAKLAWEQVEIIEVPGIGLVKKRIEDNHRLGFVS